MRKRLALTAAALLLAGCGYKTAYEEAVHDMEPVYCYRELAQVVCHQEPDHAAAERLVNYYGPHPDRYDRPDPPETPDYGPPPEIDYFVRDPEPVPESPKASADAPLPWRETGSAGVAPPPLAARASEDDAWLHDVERAVDDSR